MGVVLDILVPVIFLGIIGYARNNKSFSEAQKNGITVVFFLLIAVFLIIRVWP